MLLAASVAGVLIFGARSAPEAQEAQGYSAYDDPEKPVISYILSDPENVEELKSEFSLSDTGVDAILTATREENAALSKTYAESEAIVESPSLSMTRKREKISASGYSKKVRTAVGETKQKVEETLPEDRSADLEAWVNEQWREEVQEYNAEPAATTASRTAGTSGMTFRVYATQYFGYTRFEMALPHRKLKFDGGYSAKVSRTRDSMKVSIPIKEVGPWNTYDNYWDPISQRTMWKDLARGKPEAEAAYFNNYNRGRDEFGRKVLNPAGADLTPTAARKLGLRKYQNAWVYVRMPWVRR